MAEASRALGESTGAAEQILRDAEDAGIDLAAITGQLEREGVDSFCASYHDLLACIEGKLGEAAPRHRREARVRARGFSMAATAQAASGASVLRRGRARMRSCIASGAAVQYSMTSGLTRNAPQRAGQVMRGRIATARIPRIDRLHIQQGPHGQGGAGWRS